MPLLFAVSPTAQPASAYWRRWCVALLLVSASVFAHEGHDHADAAPLPGSGPALARAYAQSDLFELVLEQLPDQRFQLYLDQFSSNAPVAGATVELESGALKQRLTTNAQGVAQLALPALASAGEHPLVFTIRAGQQDDLLETTLRISPAAPVAEAAPLAPAVPGGWAILAVVVAGPLGFWLGKRGARS